MSDQVGTSIGAGVGGVGGSFFGPAGTAIGATIGGLAGSLFNGGPTTDPYAGYDKTFTQNEENQTQQNLDFWKQWFGNQNPEGPVMQVQSSTPGFQQGAQNAENYAQNADQLAEPGGSGNLDLTALTRAFNNQANLQGGAEDIGNTISDFNANAQRSNQYGAQGLSRLGEEQNLNQIANQTLPMSRANVNMSTQDFVNALRASELAAQGSPATSIAGSLGNFAGYNAANTQSNAQDQLLAYEPNNDEALQQSLGE